jgi:hypothetical protein
MYNNTKENQRKPQEEPEVLVRVLPEASAADIRSMFVTACLDSVTFKVPGVELCQPLADLLNELVGWPPPPFRRDPGCPEVPLDPWDGTEVSRYKLAAKEIEEATDSLVKRIAHCAHAIWVQCCEPQWNNGLPRPMQELVMMAVNALGWHWSRHAVRVALRGIKYPGVGR